MYCIREKIKFLAFMLIVLISIKANSFAQHIDKVWPLGYACCQYPGFGAVNMNFSLGNPVYTTLSRHQNLNAANGSACDSLGNLLFTTNGIYVSNALDDTMQNGSGLNPSYYTDQHIANGITLPQANLVLPSLNNSNQYLLFHNTIDDYFNTGASINLYYSIIDMSSNGGLGEVLNKNTILFSDSMVPGRITATRHANGRDWWIVVHKIHSADVFEFLYTPFGISGPFQKSLMTYRYFYLGQCGFSPQGNKFAYFVKDTGLEIADFDRCTGEFFNVTQHEIIDSAIYGAGLAFSPNGRFLYVSTVEYLYQYDTWSSNIDSSRMTVGIYDFFMDTTTTTNVTHFWLMALAPDGKIYMSTSSSTPYLHVINNPDSAGLACDFCQHCIQLPIVNAFTMPNFPNFSLGREVGSFCDSLTNDVPKMDVENLISIYPNPASQSIRVKYDLKAKSELLIYDQLGKQVLQISLDAYRKEISIDVTTFNNGIYFFKISGKEFSKVLKFSVMH